MFKPIVSVVDLSDRERTLGSSDYQSAFLSSVLNQSGSRTCLLTRISHFVATPSLPSWLRDQHLS